jgi:Tol biopolymer transport system component
MRPVVALLLGLGVFLALSRPSAATGGTAPYGAGIGVSMSNGVIAFTGGSANASLDTINPSTSQLRTLAYCHTTRCGIAYGTWSRNGDEIAFVRGRLDSHGGILLSSNMAVFVAGAHGRGERQVARCGQVGCAGLDWSPDNTRLVISRNKRLFVLTLRTGAMRQLTRCGSPCIDLEPQWSPDGSRIAFVRSFTGCRGACPALPYVVNVDGSHLKRLRKEQYTASSVSWSPDGRHIAIDNNGLYIANADGTHLSQLVPDAFPRANRVLFGVSWDPSGSRLLYVSAPFLSSRTTTAPTQGWVMNADGTGRRLVYHTGCCGGFVNMTWSPNGQQIAFSSTAYTDSNYTVDQRRSGTFTMDAQGGHVHRLLTEAVGSLAWQPVP